MKYLLTVAVILILFLVFPSSYLHPQNGFEYYLPLLTALFAARFLVYEMLNESGFISGLQLIFYKSKINKEEVRVGVILITCFSAIVFFTLETMWRDAELRDELYEDGVEIEGVVVAKGYHRHRSDTAYWYSGEFIVANRIYSTQEQVYSYKTIYNTIEVDSHRGFIYERDLVNIGDTLIITYSIRDPENNFVNGLKKDWYRIRSIRQK